MAPRQLMYANSLCTAGAAEFFSVCLASYREERGCARTVPVLHRTRFYHTRRHSSAGSGWSLIWDMQKLTFLFKSALRRAKCLNLRKIWNLNLQRNNNISSFSMSLPFCFSQVENTRSMWLSETHRQHNRGCSGWLLGCTSWLLWHFQGVVGACLWAKCQNTPPPSLFWSLQLT